MDKNGRRLRTVKAVTDTPRPIVGNGARRVAKTATRSAVKYGPAIPRIVQAELRGTFRFMRWVQKYINADNYSDMRDGKPTNAKHHHEIVKERRMIAAFWFVVVIIIFRWSQVNYGEAAVALFCGLAATGLFFWGKDQKIVDPLAGTSIGLSETGIQAAVASAVLGINLERFPDAWKSVRVKRGLRQDGETMRITLALPGAYPGTLALTRREKLASALELTTSQCIIDPDPSHKDASEVEIVIHPGEPWRKDSVHASLAKSPQQTSIWDDIDFAEDINGRPVTLSLAYKAMLLGGLPDMGKTTAGLNVLLHAMLDPWVRLWTIDAKGVDFPGIAPMCWRYVGNSQDDALAMLDELYRAGEAKMDRLRELGKQKLDRGLQNQEIQSEVITPLCFVDLLFIDEMRFFTAGDDPQKSREIVSKLSRIVEMFRAVGIIVVCATQRPSANVVDPILRDLIRIRGALATTTWQTSNTILGDTAHKKGYTATEFDSEDKGVMWLRELKKFVQCRAHWIESVDFNGACQFAFKMREQVGTLPRQIEAALVPTAPPFLAMLRTVIQREGQGRLPTKEILAAPEFNGHTADTLGKAARKHHLASNEVGPWGDVRKVRGYRLDDIAVAVAECAKDPAFKPGIRGVV